LRSSIFLLCIAAVAGLSRAPSKSVTLKHQPPLLPREEFLHLVGASQQQVIADYFWILVIQATGTAQTPEEYRDIFDYADLITNLDPNFVSVYRFCGPAIPVNLGREVWVNTEESTQLLEKGVRVAPREIFLRIVLAYNHSYFHKNYERAARLLEETSKLRGSPRYLPALATRLYAQSGHVEAGLALARSLFETSEDPETRKTFEQRIKELELERLLRNIDAAVSRYVKREGRLPSRLEELVNKGDLPALPSDPLAGDLIIGRDGHSQSTALARRLVVYEPKKN
jgi:hypothetical protein